MKVKTRVVIALEFSASIGRGGGCLMEAVDRGEAVVQPTGRRTQGVPR